MNWITINSRHYNLDQIQEFRWDDGQLRIGFEGETVFHNIPDPDRRWYHKLCHRVSVPTVEEGDNKDD